MSIFAQRTTKLNNYATNFINYRHPDGKRDDNECS